MHFIRDAVIEEIRHIAPDELQRREAVDTPTVGLPKWAVHRTPILPSVVSDVADDLAPPYLFKFASEHALIIHYERRARVRIDHGPQAWAGLRHCVTMLPKEGKLCPVSANDKERRTWADLLPAIARRFRVLPKAEIRERCVQAFAHDPAISIANFIHPVRICARLSRCSQAVDDEDTRPRDGD